ncbi:DUF6705 family protein [Chryseobacterium oryzae]|uniref:DUF6705 domain-containing protein n=1 Tax=Chryseobacterium oryzae TaxID=2929799 RepID=A0ABY4BH90_9FLAO|nr:DUF6705 family protein [Chryseobacterium oryzae]UOE38538.1 hypothetical protein MTP08_01805 [Chryseobacterium oryzae]
MKQILLIFILFSIYCKSQEYPLNTSLDNLPNNTYLKDTNNDLNKYIGIWRGNWNGKTLFLDLRKVKYHYTRDTLKLSSKTVIELKRIISKIDETSTSDLEIKIPGTFWLMIDGTIYKLNIPYKGKNRILWASKNIKRYPLIYELIVFVENIRKNSSL